MIVLIQWQKSNYFNELNVIFKILCKQYRWRFYFILTTDPSEFAASLNKIGVSYKVAYTVSIALRYIPDVQRDCKDISFAQQARGIDLSSKEKLSKRIKNSAAILMPLIFSSLERIDKISLAMELELLETIKSVLGIIVENLGK